MRIMGGRVRRWLFFTLFLSVIVHAASSYSWQAQAVIGVTISTFLLSLIYLIGKALEIRELQFLAKEDMFWVFAVALMIGGFAALTTLLNVLVNPTGGSIHSQATAVINGLLGTLQSSGSSLKSLTDSIAKQGSKSVFCSFGGFGFNIAACGGFSYVGSSFTFVYQFIGVGIAQLYALHVFLSIASSYVFAFFLPIGLFLVAFPMFRGAGSVLLAIGITFYVVIPYAIVISNNTILSAEPIISHEFGTVKFHVPHKRECDPYSFSQGGGLGRFFSTPTLAIGSGASENEAKAIGLYAGFLVPLHGNMSTIDFFIWLIGFRVTLLTVVVLVSMLAAIQFLSQVFGTPVTPYTLQRLV